MVKVRELGQSRCPARTGWPGRRRSSRCSPTCRTSDQNAMTDLVDNLRAAITVAPPAGMQVHLAGRVRHQRRPAEAVGQDRQPGAGRRVRFHPGPAAADLPVAARAADHGDPRAAVGIDRRADHRRARQPRAEGLAAVPAAAHRAGARRRHGLRPVPGVPGAGTAAAGRRLQGRGGQRADQGRRVHHLLRLHGHRGAAFAAVRHLPDLLQPGHTARHRHRRDAAGRPDPAARAARDLRQGGVLAVEAPSRARRSPACGAGSPRACSSGRGSR